MSVRKKGHVQKFEPIALSSHKPDWAQLIVYGKGCEDEEDSRVGQEEQWLVSHCSKGLTSDPSTQCVEYIEHEQQDQVGPRYS